MATITRADYMANASELHQDYYSQFVTESTKRFILNSLKVEDIRAALENGDKHLNKIKIPFNNMGQGGGWWWDNAPANITLMKECKELNSPSTRTCIAKAAARMLVEESSK